MDELIRSDVRTHNSFQVPTIISEPRGRGRPKYLITSEQLEYLVSLRFSWNEISALLGVSRMTLYRRRREFGMLFVSDTLPSISNNQLREVLVQMRRQYPNFGETMTMGHVRSLGYHVSRSQLRDAIHVTDPIQTALRWRGGLTPRRPYSVPGPNSLWHIGKIG